MIARIFILLVVIIILPDAYLFVNYVKRRNKCSNVCTILWWTPTAIMLAYTIALSLMKDFVSGNMLLTNIYLLLLGLIYVPKFLIALFSFLGRLLCRAVHIKLNIGIFIGVVLSFLSLYVLLYGAFVGSKQLVVKHLDLYFKDLPTAFDGYKMTQFSDLHIGSMDESMLNRIVKTINSQSADAILFTGDLQNVRPSELDGYESPLSSLHAKDGVYSVLGNHDYAMYVKETEEKKRLLEQEVVKREQSFGWQLLRNEHVVLHRDNDSIAIAGEENDGNAPFPQKANIKKTLTGLSPNCFKILLQHDPSAWRRHVLHKTNIQLTLSGHTHGGQISLFGLRPTAIKGKEDAGLYHQGSQFLHVSTGVGGVLPFRFGVEPEIVIITLHKQ